MYLLVSLLVVISSAILVSIILWKKSKFKAKFRRREYAYKKELYLSAGIFTIHVARDKYEYTDTRKHLLVYISKSSPIAHAKLEQSKSSPTASPVRRPHGWLAGDPRYRHSAAASDEDPLIELPWLKSSSYLKHRL